MGEVRAKIVVQNLRDIHLYEEGYLKQSDIRFLELDALADTGAVETLLPQDAAEALGLKTTDRIIVTLANDEKIELPLAGPVLITVCGRKWRGDCLIGPLRCEPLFGQLIMESLDLVVNPRAQTITVNPASPFLPSLKMK